MKEIFEFRINDDYYHLLTKPNKAKYNGLVYIIKVTKDDPLFLEIQELKKYVTEKYDDPFYFYSNVTHQYSKNELDNAVLFNILIKNTFEPCGEECGTHYDETVACKICGADRKQIGNLILKKSSIPRKDISRTIAGEVIVSEKFVFLFKECGIHGADFIPVFSSKGETGYYQIQINNKLDLTKNVIAGFDFFDLSEFSEFSEATEHILPGGYIIKSEKEVYKCPLGHTIGLRLLSEVFVNDSPLINKNDIFISSQKIGAKIGLLSPEPLYICSQAFRKMVLEKGLTGFNFDVAYIQ